MDNDKTEYQLWLEKAEEDEKEAKQALEYALEIKTFVLSQIKS